MNYEKKLSFNQNLFILNKKNRKQVQRVGHTVSSSDCTWVLLSLALAFYLSDMTGYKNSNLRKC